MTFLVEKMVSLEDESGLEGATTSLEQAASAATAAKAANKWRAFILFNDFRIDRIYGHAFVAGRQDVLSDQDRGYPAERLGIN